MPAVSASPTPFQGLWIPLVTPFHDGAVDHPSLARMTKKLAGQGIAGFVACGSTGEAAALDKAEQLAVLETVLDASQGLPVVVGLSGYHLGQTVEWVQTLARYPLAGLLVPAPHYIRPSQDGLLQWFRTLADASSVPLVVYDIPYRTGATLATDTLLALAEHPRICAIKDCGGNAAKTQALIADGRLAVLAGEDAQMFTTLALGGHGAIAASAHWAPGLLPYGVEPGLRETAFWTPETLRAPDAQDRVNTSAAYGFVFDVCGLEIDPNTGAVVVDRYITAHDAGRLLNPALADGQIRGAFTQGLGAALLEEFRYGVDGSFQSGTLADYLMPTACETPDPVIVHLETPSPFTPLGAKGLGEGNNMSTPVCIANAFSDALRPLCDVEDVRLPLTPARVLEHLQTPDPESTNPLARKAAQAPAAAGEGLSLSAQGTVEIAATPERVFAVLLDPVALAKVIPGCHELKTDGEGRYRADVTVGIGLIKARYEALIKLSDIQPPHSLRLAGSGSSSLGTGAGDGLVRMEATPTGTLLHYDYRAQVGGKVAMVGSRMLESAARVIVAQLFESMGRQASGAGDANVAWWRRLLIRLGVTK